MSGGRTPDIPVVGLRRNTRPSVAGGRTVDIHVPFGTWPSMAGASGAGSALIGVAGCTMAVVSGAGSGLVGATGRTTAAVSEDGSTRNIRGTAGTVSGWGLKSGRGVGMNIPTVRLLGFR